MAVGIPQQPSSVDEDLYREIILDHFRHPRHHGDVADPSGSVEAANPLCGDEVRLTWRSNGDTIEQLGFSGQGCSICMASASMLCEALTGRSRPDAVAMASGFRDLLLADGSDEGLGDVAALGGVRAYPVRVKCALLAWNALAESLGSAS